MPTLNVTSQPGRIGQVVLAAAAISVGMLAVGAPLAAAKPLSENTIKSECKDAGGTYSTGTSKGGRLSQCVYTDISGGMHVDLYKNGVYTGTL